MGSDFYKEIRALEREYPGLAPKSRNMRGAGRLATSGAIAGGMLLAGVGEHAVAEEIEVESGESPYSIMAERMPGASHDEVLDASLDFATLNGVAVTENADGTFHAIVQPGDILMMPESSTIIVQPGESLYEIAQDHLQESGSDADIRQTVNELASKNNIELNETSEGIHAHIEPGQEIKLYDQEDEEPFESHKIVPGDTLSEIAEDAGVDVDSLAAANNIIDPDFLQVGDSIAIPQIDGTKEFKSVEVQPGDTLSELAQENNTTIEELQELNVIPDPDVLVAGENIVSPKSGSTSKPRIETPAADIISPAPSVAPEIAQPEPQLAEPIPALQVEEQPESPGQQKPKSERLILSDQRMYRRSELLTPPNLGPINSEGYYRMPQNNDLYGWSDKDYPLVGMSGSPPESRCASLSTIRKAYTAVSVLHEKYPSVRWVFGDFTEADGHASHRNGNDLDFYDEGGVGTSTSGDPEIILDTLKAFARVGMQDAFISDYGIIEEFNAWAEQVGAPMRASYEDGHDEHLHFRDKNEFRGVYSEQCAPDTKGKGGNKLNRGGEISHADIGLENLSDTYDDVIQQKPTLEYARENYDLWRTGDPGPKLPKKDVAILAYAAGWRGEDLVIATAMGIGAEGGSAPYVVNTAAALDPNFDNSTIAVGLWQMLYTPQFDEELRDPMENLDPWKNAQNAHALWEIQGWRGWEAYTNDSYQNHMENARMVVNEMKSELD